MEIDNLKTEYEAAQILGLSVGTLQAMRVGGTGPAFVKLGTIVRYRTDDLVSFIETNCVQPQRKRTARTETEL